MADPLTPYGWTVDQVLEATGGRLVAGDRACAFAGVAIDSRTIAADQLFVAIAGESHDGHGFIAAVLDKGVKGIVVAEARIDQLPTARLAAGQIACVAVADTTRALQDLARFNRNRGPLLVVAITGSNGKTSTRRLCEQVVGGDRPTLSTKGNLNNHIGLPLTLLNLAPGHRAAVLELGMNHPGEIAALGAICQPDLAVITNVGPAHLEGLGSVENVARAKAELLATVRPGGTAILNADDDRVAAMADDFDGSVLFFGEGQKAAVRADRVTTGAEETQFELIALSGRMAVTLATPTRVMVKNALAAAAVGEQLGIGLAAIKRGLEAFAPRPGRMGISKPGRGIDLIDDSYNANPASMLAAIETLAAMAGERRTVLIVGDMLELGDQAEALHRQVGAATASAGIQRLYAAGAFARAVADGAMEAAMDAAAIFHGEKEALIARLFRELTDGDLILVKGSRGMAMETVVAAIGDWATADPHQESSTRQAKEGMDP